MRNVIIAMAKRSPFTRKALEASILPKVLRMICLQYGPTKASVSNHSEGDSSVARFNEAMKSLSMAISDPGHCKVLLSQNPHSADPIVKAHSALTSLDQIIAYSDGWASRTSLPPTAIPVKWDCGLKPAIISSGTWQNCSCS